MKNYCKLKFHCIGGPFAGKTIKISTDGNTFVFTVGGWTGRYVKGVWNAQVS